MARFRRRRRIRLAVPRIEPRIAALSILVGLLWTGLGLRLYYLQIIDHQHLAELADRNRIRLRPVPAPRGLVFDRRSRALVDTVPRFDAVIVPEDTDDLEATIHKLQKYLGEDQIGNKLEQAEEEGRPAYQPVVVGEKLEWKQVVQIETHQLELPGVSVDALPRRHYPYGTLAAHLLGYMGEVNENDLATVASYRLGDEIGKFGLERSWEDYLRGTSGGQEIEVDAVGRRLRLLKEIPDEPGKNIILTIDFDLQRMAEEAMGDHAGALVALDPNNGDILAMVSRPAFDPNVFAGGIRSAQWRQLTGDLQHPLQNRVIQGIYPPGSTFKLVDMIAGLQDHILTPATSFYCPGGIWYGGREYRCWRKQGHGQLELHRALVQSCDVYFYEAGQRIGVDRIAHWANLLGLGQRTGIDLKNEQVGLIPSSAWKRRRFGERWYPAETLSVAIGQGYVAVTPLQMAQLAAEIAAGGKRYKPRFVRAVTTPEGRVAKAYPPVLEAQIDLDPAVLETVRDAMCDVVNSPGGTGTQARLPDVTVCGKTGTAQVLKEAQGLRTAEQALAQKFRDHGWFIAFAPRDHPRIAIACVVEHGGHGGSSAAPIVRQVLAKFFKLSPAAPPENELTERSGQTFVVSR